MTEHFIKLHYSILNDWKIGTLPDSLKWRFINMLLFAGKVNKGGYVGTLIDDLPMDSPVQIMIDNGLLLRSGSSLFVSHLFGEYFEIGADALNHTTNYHDSLKSQRWRHYRNTVFIRDNFSCVRCGFGPPEVILNCHHLTYENVGNEKLSDCQTLCHICHTKEHGLATVSNVDPGAFNQTRNNDE